MNDNKGIIDEMWFGYINPRDKVLTLNSEEIDKASSEIDYLHYYLSCNLEGEVYENLCKYEVAHGEYSMLLAEEAFREGFSLAIKLFVSGMKEK